MKQTKIIILKAVTSMVALIVLLQRPGWSQPKPNMVVLLADDLGYGDLGVYGNPIIKSPNLDKMASEGMLFTDFYAMTVCAPSRASLQTGRSTSRHGVTTHSNGSLDGEITIAELLKSAGYDTFIAGKWHLGSLAGAGAHGYDHWMLTENNASPSHANPSNFTRNGSALGALNGFSCDIIVAEAVSWLNNRNSRKPFLTVLTFHNTHVPIGNSQQYLNMYIGDPHAEYYANVTHLDAAIGNFLDKLDSLGYADSTLVIFTSDNGPEKDRQYGGADLSYGTPGGLRSLKRRMYEGGLRVPGIIRWPGHITPGSRSYEPASLMDIFPTLASLGGASLPAGVFIDGVNLSPLFSGNRITRRFPIYIYHPLSYIYNDLNIFIRMHDWKLLTDDTRSRYELYHLRFDAGERNNLADREPEKLNQMIRLLDNYERTL